jgi:hypothetical protein
MYMPWRKIMQRAPRHIVDIAIGYQNRRSTKRDILSMLEAELKNAEAYLDYGAILGLKLAIAKVSGYQE